MRSFHHPSRLPPARSRTRVVAAAALFGIAGTFALVVSCKRDYMGESDTGHEVTAGAGQTFGGSETNPPDGAAGGTHAADDRNRVADSGFGGAAAKTVGTTSDAGNGEVRSDAGGGGVTSGAGSGGEAGLSGDGNSAPPAWTCDSAHYGSSDGCDCGCGARDRDCGEQLSISCARMDDPGSCVTLGGTLDDLHNWACIECGNLVASLNEPCDGDDFAGRSCTNIGAGFSGGELRCSAGCLLDFGACTGTAHETFCDDGYDNDGNNFQDCGDPICQGSDQCKPGPTKLGEPCGKSNECQANGGDPLCLKFYFPDGACSEWCDASASDCAGSGLCLLADPTTHQGACFPSCAPGIEGACRTGYTCCADVESHQFACFPDAYVGYWCGQP